MGRLRIKKVNAFSYFFPPKMVAHTTVAFTLPTPWPQCALAGPQSYPGGPTNTHTHTTTHTGIFHALSSLMRSLLRLLLPNGGVCVARWWCVPLNNNSNHSNGHTQYAHWVHIFGSCAWWWWWCTHTHTHIHTPTHQSPRESEIVIFHPTEGSFPPRRRIICFSVWMSLCVLRRLYFFRCCCYCYCDWLTSPLDVFCLCQAWPRTTTGGISLINIMLVSGQRSKRQAHYWSLYSSSLLVWRTLKTMESLLNRLVCRTGGRFLVSI